MLVGLPGSGKTAVGRRVAAALARRFLDFDEEIERREGRPVAQIFASHGEAHFRGLEQALTREICGAGGGMVLAPGGGWITIPGVVDLVRPAGVVIYLRARPETALRRMGRGRARRPLLETADPLGALAKLFEQRARLYEAAADHVVDTEMLDVQRVTARVVEWLSLFRGNQVKPGG